jgi:hypothetical protein
MYIHIMQVYRRAPVGAEPSTHACTCISARMRTHEGMGCSRTRMEPPMRVGVRASGHPYTPRGTSVDTDARCTDGYTTLARAHKHTHTCARSQGIYMHAHTHTCTRTYVRRCMHVLIHVSWARACAAPETRSHARVNTHTHLHGIYTYTHMHVHALTHTHTHMVTHISRSRGRVAPPLAHTHSCTSACALARWNRMLRAHADIHTCAHM